MNSYFVFFFENFGRVNPTAIQLRTIFRSCIDYTFFSQIISDFSIFYWFFSVFFFQFFYDDCTKFFRVIYPSITNICVKINHVRTDWCHLYFVNMTRCCIKLLNYNTFFGTLYSEHMLIEIGGNLPPCVFDRNFDEKFFVCAFWGTSPADKTQNKLQI